ncbi:bacterioferritin-associated ferredoxin [Desulfohalotomaculum tongense]|uniref:Csac_0668 family 2Fe-2S cluster-binding (seleno)protein n=1 Tax=Desulforadius tongensis TaxID=1216062 RepID=UPI001959E46F|nr:(2Fe-2S)-binding protein [Desulforadius tongensis]MBM7853916.1 bacterioferritin-associated ferredoxin [Desulforadius tongensis]
MSNGCCCCREKKVSLGPEDSSTLCPVCRKPGVKVKNITVKHLVADEFIDQVGNADYYLCMNEGCEVVYYNLKLAVKFDKKQIRVPVWFKKDADPKYVCYCSRVTEEEVIAAVVKNGASTVEDIVNLTGAMKNARCQVNNPLGKCCHPAIRAAIEKGLAVNNQSSV